MSNFVILKWWPFEYKVKSWIICPFLGFVFFRNKNADILNFSWIKYFGNNFSSHKITYMGQLFLKLRAVGLDCKLVYILGKTVQYVVLDSYLRQIASRWRCSDVFNVIFEIDRHLFVVFLLLTLNIIFLAKYVVSKVT